ncbi:hypothetical protein DPSP01_009987 [Paraphaeosphaeria sporulosa]
MLGYKLNKLNFTTPFPSADPPIFISPIRVKVSILSPYQNSSLQAPKAATLKAPFFMERLHPSEATHSTLVQQMYPLEASNPTPTNPLIPRSMVLHLAFRLVMAKLTLLDIQTG